MKLYIYETIYLLFVEAKPPPASSSRRLGTWQRTLFIVLCMTVGIAPYTFAPLVCAVPFISIYGSWESVGTFVEGAALRHVLQSVRLHSKSE